MSVSKNSVLSRRGALKVTAASAFAGAVLPHVHAGGSDVIKVALVGAGGRGRGAASQALSVPNGNTRLVAIADVSANNLRDSVTALERPPQQRARMDVSDERKFIGFDGYRRAMDTLRRGDVVILATPPAFRWPQFAYAIEKGLHVFMEKPISVDGPSTRRMIELGERAQRANLKVGVGLMCRHCDVRRELFSRIQDNQIGDLTMIRAYRVAGPTASAFTERRRPNDPSELLYQIRNFHSFLWLSGGAFSDFLIHNIDEGCWMKNDFPVSAKGYGGRHYRGNYIDQNFDVYSTEYTFADGTKMFMEGRIMQGCDQEFATYVHGTRGSAVVSQSGHTPSRARIYRGHNMTNNADVIWRGPQREPDPYQLEWNRLIDAIRNDRPHNEVLRGAMASLVTSMGRMACHTGKVITRDQILNGDHEFAPNVDQLTMDGPSPLQADADGKYPVPRPGQETRREY